EYGRRVGRDFAEDVHHRIDTTAIFGDQVGEQLDPEADVALLVEGHVAHALAEAGQDVLALQVALDEVLPRLGQRGLDDQVVQGDRRRQLGPGPVAAQLLAHAVKPGEGLAEAPGQLGAGGGERSAHPGAVWSERRFGAVARRACPAVAHRRRRAARPADLDDLAKEAVEEHGVADFVHLLRGQEVLLLLPRGGVYV